MMFLPGTLRLLECYSSVSNLRSTPDPRAPLNLFPAAGKTGIKLITGRTAQPLRWIIFMG